MLSLLTAPGPPPIYPHAGAWHSLGKSAASPNGNANSLNRFNF
jgi:hypothetical protein